uniref:Uncharacterized protein n=1 Tax=Leptospira santarosai serovar Arenal str. MAVJ 401 TaxID=1049976 RepID=M6JJ75_9LEPT|nr:hypothetical protein LEP1GSC063_2776 [Leptospira santarosai serovar Arenal str. MAVJ 401]
MGVPTNYVSLRSFCGLKDFFTMKFVYGNSDFVRVHIRANSDCRTRVILRRLHKIQKQRSQTSA